MNITYLDGHTLNPGDLSWGPLEELGNFTVYERTDSEDIVDRASDADIILSNKVVLSADILAQLPKLRYIGVTATGYNNVDLAAARKQGIVVTNVAGYSTSAVAQHTFSLLLGLTNHTELHSQSVRAGDWTNAADWCYWKTPLVEIAGKTIGLIGLGDIGTQVARIALAFGMRVLAHRKSKASAGVGIELVELDELFRESDVVSLHCPLTDDTSGIINAGSLAKMKPSAYLINTGRGGLINEQDLADALNADRIAGAAVDVLSTEPPKADNPLLTAKNCLITPHVAWAFFESRQRLMQMVADNIIAFQKGQPTNVVS
ncbi:D-2-hydroxyacid dehydrogenase [Persicitalea jodogahamensis]|uniref:Glycerate dehydrogenase n=1 Tax=Persicitalea jodogahamensis TaxID=402147 RepID=A0A8J3D501_9BACT|nr:D-2-hydroxyacid dehydrogenase [Persicitalea jodogahamensis]GHB54208.1 glycerate dehydrogenase [Persicitalea jodogahamensis]